MRILVFSTRFPNPVEPSNGSYVYRPLQSFPPEHELIIIAPVLFFQALRKRSKERILWKQKLELGHDMVRVFHPRYLLNASGPFAPVTGLFLFLSCLPRLHRLHKHQRIDLIHTHGGFPDGFAVSLLSRLFVIPFIISEHKVLSSKMLNNRWIGSLVRGAYSRAAAITTVSNANAQDLATINNLITVIPNGLDFNRYSVAPARQKPELLVVIAKLLPSKGIQYLIKAIDSLRYHGKIYKLDIIGEGNFKNALIKQVQKLNLGDQVAFKGQMTHSQIEELLPHFDALIVPSLTSSTNLVIIEAMASGLPVVATRSGSTETILNSDTGILVNPGSSEELEHGIMLLDEKWDSFNPYLIRDYAQDRYSLDGVMEAYSALYSTILNRRRF